jgi:hypothetical protein
MLPNVHQKRSSVLLGNLLTILMVVKPMLLAEESSHSFHHFPIYKPNVWNEKYNVTIDQLL